MKPAIFEIFENEKLTRPLILLKQIGKTCMLVCIIGAAVAQFTQKDAHENLLYDVALQVAGLGFVIAMLCFAAIALATINKTSSNTTAQAIGTTLLKVLLYVFLPAVVITIVLTLIFVLPWYQ